MGLSSTYWKVLLLNRPTATRVMLEVHTKKGVWSLHLRDYRNKVAQVTTYARSPASAHVDNGGDLKAVPAD
jgi:ATP-dependent Clp protease adapter protein ClpS